MATYKPDPLITGEHIAGQQYQAQLGMPKKQDVDAEMYKDIRSSLGEKPRGWRAAAAGFTRGLEQGSKLSALEERKDDLKKYNKVMDYFQEVNNHALERKEEFEVEEKAKRAALPYALSYIKNYSQYDPVTQKEAMQKIVDISNGITGDNIEIIAVDGKDGTQATARDRDTGEVAFFSLNQLFPEEALQAEAATSLPSYQLKLQEQRQQREIENQLARDQLGIQRFNAETNRMGMQNKYSDSGRPDEFTKQLSKEEGKQVIQFRNDIIQDKKAADKLKDVVKDIKEAINSGAATNEGQLSRITNYLGTSYGGKKATATQIMDMAAGSLIPRIKEAFGGRVTNTDLEFAEKHMLPGQHLSKEANMKFLNGLEKFIQKKENEFKRSEEIIRQNNGQIPRDYVSRLNEVDTVEVVLPNGKLAKVKKDQLNGRPTK